MTDSPPASPRGQDFAAGAGGTAAEGTLLGEKVNGWDNEPSVK